MIERGETHTPMLFGRFRMWLVMVAAVVILAGLLFGYDQGVIAGERKSTARDPRRSSQLGDVLGDH